MSRFTRYILKRVFLFLFPAKVAGLHHIPKKGAVIIAGNHISLLDGVYVWTSLRRNIFFLVVMESFLRPFIGRILKRNGQIAVDQTDRYSGRPCSGASALRAAEEVLAKGGMIGIHPEGYCSKGKMDVFQLGVIRLAFATGSPVVPVGIIGSREVVPDFNHAPRVFTTVHLNFGEPIDVKGLTNTLENRRWLRRTLEEKVAELSHQPPPRERHNDNGYGLSLLPELISEVASTSHAHRMRLLSQWVDLHK